MKRTDFIRLIAGITGITGLVTACRSPVKKIAGKIVGASAAIGHLIRDGKFPKPAETIQLDVVIIGGGVSGLSAARHLHRNGCTNFLVLELEQSPGGNSVSGKNDLSAYPWGAHYVPIPNNNLEEYLQLMQECGAIEGFDNSGLPVYNESFICFDPEERLYINGRWQEGLIPSFGVPEEEAKQIRGFFAEMDAFRTMTGKDGLPAFSIPVDTSSNDPGLTALDSITMMEWLRSKGFTSAYLNTYVDYCTRDDFGTPSKICSAWAGIHYFASRKGKGSNAGHADVLTWPQGNGFLIDHLLKDIREKVLCNKVVVSVSQTPGSVLIDYLDPASGKVTRVEASQCIMAVPQFVAGRLLGAADRIRTVKEHYKYMSWMVANIRTGELEERSGFEMSWDNVLHGKASLGYVEATHQLLRQSNKERNLTWYLPLTGESVTEERTRAMRRTHDEWVDIISEDLVRVHPNFVEAVKEIDVMVWGHAMVQTLPGLIKSDIRRNLSAPLDNQVFFAHTDLAGISIFEEGFYQGINAAARIVSLRNKMKLP